MVTRQRCWVHLIREFKDLAKKHKEAEVLVARIKDIYQQLVVYVGDIPNDTVKEHLQFELSHIITCLDETRWGRKLAGLIKNGGDDWFTA